MLRWPVLLHCSCCWMSGRKRACCGLVVLCFGSVISRPCGAQRRAALSSPRSSDAQLSSSSTSSFTLSVSRTIHVPRTRPRRPPPSPRRPSQPPRPSAASAQPQPRPPTLSPITHPRRVVSLSSQTVALASRLFSRPNGNSRAHKRCQDLPYVSSLSVPCLPRRPRPRQALRIPNKVPCSFDF